MPQILASSSIDLLSLASYIVTRGEKERKPLDEDPFVEVQVPPHHPRLPMLDRLTTRGGIASSRRGEAKKGRRAVIKKSLFAVADGQIARRRPFPCSFLPFDISLH